MEQGGEEITTSVEYRKARNQYVRIHREKKNFERNVREKCKEMELFYINVESLYYWTVAAVHKLKKLMENLIIRKVLDLDGMSLTTERTN